MSLMSTIVALGLPAQADANAAPAPNGSPIFLLLIFFFIFYLMVLRPQTKARRSHDALKAGLKKGDKVVTDGGIIGTVHKVEEGQVVLDVGNRVHVSFLKHSIRQRLVQDADGKE
jgi:preprotein translocase subunit YajC